MNENFIDELRCKLSEGSIIIDELMARHTTYKIGGKADVFVVPENKEELVNTIKVCRKYNVDFFILGKGSNLLISDNGFRGVVINVSSKMGKIDINGEEIYAEAGAGLINASHRAYESSLLGLEFACGVPGTIGGAIYMNAGCYGGEMKGIITEVELLDTESNIVTYTNEQMKFDYRYSCLKDNGYIVLSAKMRLKQGDKEIIGANRDRIKQHRQNGQPIEWPSAGSVFKRPEEYFPGKLIEDLGLKGHTIGGAQVSEKHANFIINIGGATAKDVFCLMKYVQREVYEVYSVILESEIKVLGEIE